MEYNNEAAKKIFLLLSPLLGTMMADATLKVQCKKLNISLDELSASHLVAFARNVEMGLVIFVGTDRARRIASNIENLFLSEEVAA